MGPVVPVHDELMGTGDEVEAVAVIILLRDVLSEGEAGAAWTDTPAGPVVGVGPKEVAHGSLMRDFLNPVELPYVVDGVDGRAQAAVEAKYVIVDKGREGEVVEQVREELPNVCTPVLSDALVIKAIDLGDLSGFVVAAKDEDTVGVADLQTDQHGYCLNGVVPSIDCNVVNIKQWPSETSLSCIVAESKRRVRS